MWEGSRTDWANKGIIYTSNIIHFVCIPYYTLQQISLPVDRGNSVIIIHYIIRFKYISVFLLICLYVYMIVCIYMYVM